MSIQHVTTKRESENKNIVNSQPSFFSGTNNKYALLKLLNPRIHQWHNGEKGRERNALTYFFEYVCPFMTDLLNLNMKAADAKYDLHFKNYVFKSMNSWPEQQRRRSKKKKFNLHGKSI